MLTCLGSGHADVTGLVREQAWVELQGLGLSGVGVRGTRQSRRVLHSYNFRFKLCSIFKPLGLEITNAAVNLSSNESPGQQIPICVGEELPVSLNPIPTGRWAYS